ncbi:hypothetical protein Bca4012_099167 [Brassica carinata]
MPSKEYSYCYLNPNSNQTHKDLNRTKPPRIRIKSNGARMSTSNQISSARSSSVRDAVDVRSRPPVVIALRRVSSTSASPRLKPTPSPSPNHVLSLCRVSAPS